MNNGTSSFPYDLKQLIETRGLGALKNTPVGNELVLDMALLLVEKEELGKDKYTDFLGVASLYGLCRTHLRRAIARGTRYVSKIDRQLGKLIKKLDKEVGRDAYVIYLTADHGASENPNHLAYHGLGVRNFQNADVIGDVNERIKEELGIENAVFKIFNHHIHLNSWAKERAGEIALVVEATDPFMRVYTASKFATAEMMLC